MLVGLFFCLAYLTIGFALRAGVRTRGAPRGAQRFGLDTTPHAHTSGSRVKGLHWWRDCCSSAAERLALGTGWTVVRAHSAVSWIRTA